MFIDLICPHCNHRIERVLYPLFGDLEADCPACGLHIEIAEGRLGSLVFSDSPSDEPGPPSDEPDPYDMPGGGAR